MARFLKNQIFYKLFYRSTSCYDHRPLLICKLGSNIFFAHYSSFRDMSVKQLHYAPTRWQNEQWGGQRASAGIPIFIYRERYLLLSFLSMIVGMGNGLGTEVLLHASRCRSGQRGDKKGVHGVYTTRTRGLWRLATRGTVYFSPPSLSPPSLSSFFLLSPSSFTSPPCVIGIMPRSP